MRRNSDLKEGDGSVDRKEEMVLRHFKNKMNGLGYVKREKKGGTPSVALGLDSGILFM